MWYNKGMTVGEIAKRYDSVVEDYRSMCFWNLAEDFLPRTPTDLALVAENLEKYGDLKAYKIAGEIRKWL